MPRNTRGPAIWQMAAALLGAVAAIVLVFFGVLKAIDAAVPKAPKPVEVRVATRTAEPALAADESTVPAKPAAPSPAPAPKPEPKPAKQYVVVIDAGHQGGRPDTTPEPIGPGAKETKPAEATGTHSTTTGMPEAQLTLDVALKLQKDLEARGVKVIMVRTNMSQHVANSTRAKIANDARADLFLRVHADGADDPKRYGVSTLVPARNQWTGPIVAPSRVAAGFVHKAVLAATGAKDNGVVPRSDLTGFNWSKVPTVLVEMGFMTNPREDALMRTPAYQDKLAQGMAEGTMAYLRAR